MDENPLVYIIVAIVSISLVSSFIWWANQLPEKGSRVIEVPNVGTWVCIYERKEFKGETIEVCIGPVENE